MRRGLAVALLIVVVAAAWVPIRNARRGYHSSQGARVERFTLQSQLLHRRLHEILVLPGGHVKPRALLVFCTAAALLRMTRSAMRSSKD